MAEDDRCQRIAVDQNEGNQERRSAACLEGFRAGTQHMIDAELDVQNAEACASLDYRETNQKVWFFPDGTGKESIYFTCRKRQL